MPRRTSDWKYALTIALFAFGSSSYPAQDTAQSTPVKSDSKSAVSSTTSDTAKKTATGTSIAGETPVPGSKMQPAAKTPKDLQKKKAAGEEIIDEEDLILPEKGEPLPEKKAAQQAPAGEDTARGRTAAKPAGDTGRQSVDSSSSPSAPAVNTAAPAPATNAPVAKAATPVTVEDARSINFARSLKEYRSPKLAMLLSLIVPGLGQAYVGKPFNYFKAGAFVAVEAGIIGISAYYNSKGNAKFGQAKNFANANYSFDSMIVYYNNLFSFFKNDPSQNMDSATAQAKLNDIYMDTLSDTTPTSTSTFTKSYNHNHPSQDYYHTIEEGSYIHGWKGCEPSLDEIAGGDTIINNVAYRFLYQRAPDSSGNYLVNLIDRATGKPVPGNDNQLQYGYSPYQRDYLAMMQESEKYYRWATNVLFAILINHVVSAVDALISAKGYNDALLGRQTFWQNLSIQPTTAFSGAELSSGITMRVQF